MSSSKQRVYTGLLWRSILYVFILATALVVVALPELYLYFQEFPARGSFVYAVGEIALLYYLYVLLTPAIVWAGSRFGLEPPHLYRNLLIQIGVALLMSSLVVIVLKGCRALYELNQFPTWGYIYGNKRLFAHNMALTLVFYSLIFILTQAYLYSRRYQDREFRLQEAELQTLRMQLQPHFLFNTLNAISGLTYTSPQFATQLIAQVSDLLRQTLYGSKAHEIPLRDELDFLRKYLQIQEALLQERLEVIWTVDPRVLDALVPNVILQPLVENAIQHGIGPQEKGGQLEIVAGFTTESRRQLTLQVRDKVEEVVTSRKTVLSAGIGLANARARLGHLYGKNYSLEVQPSETGWTVSMSIPFREAK